MRSIALTATLALLFSSTQANDLASKDCRKVSSCSDCINYLNDDLLDGTKCIPTTSDGVCKSWSDVQHDSTGIDYGCNWSGISAGENT